MFSRFVREWWSDPVDYVAQVQYFAKRVMSGAIQVLIGVGTGLNALISLVILLPSASTRTSQIVVGMFAVLQIFWAWSWCWRPWPSRRMSLAFVVSADIGIAAIALLDGSWLLGLFGFNAFAMISVYLMFFDGPKVLAGHALWILISTAAFAAQVGGDANFAVTSFTASTVIAVAPVVATPLGIQLGIWAMRNDANESVTDPLTGLLNRRGLQLHVGDLVRDNTTASEVAVMVVDLDRFKEINDSFGHTIGDEVLVRSARRIMSAVRGSALVARVGGEEFVIVDLAEPGRDAQWDFDRVRHAIAAPAEHAITASVGVTSVALASFAGVAVDSAGLLDTIIERADRAMFDAKRNNPDVYDLCHFLPHPATVGPVTVSGSRVARIYATGIVVLAFATAPSCGPAAHPPPGTTPPGATPQTTAPATVPQAVPADEFEPVSRQILDAIAAPRMPGAVVQIGHAGKVVFRQAFGARRLADEPGLDGSPAPAESMTVDTIFDLASLTKSVATTTALLQLYEKDLVRIDEPVQTYLPDFNPSNDARRAQVTLRMLLTHTSGIAGDLSLDGPWGLGPADKDDGIRRALGAWVVFDPGTLFHYSDINFILVGTIIERITGEPLDSYVPANVFAPLGMSDTRYLPAGKACGPHEIRGTAIALGQNPPWVGECPAGMWSTALLPRVAPTSHDGDTPGLNPNFEHLLRGTVHDPTARRMGGVSGSAGLFSTVEDLGRYAQALLDRLAGRPSRFPLKQSTLELITAPQQPGHDATQLDAANDAAREAVETAPNTTDPLLAPNYPAIAGQDLRGFGWDIDTEQSRPRGMIFPVGSFGHTGFTGVTLWLDPGSNTYVTVLANVIHQRGGPPIAGLSGEVATLTARILSLYGS